MFVAEITRRQICGTGHFLGKAAVNADSMHPKPVFEVRGGETIPDALMTDSQFDRRRASVRIGQVLTIHRC